MRDAKYASYQSEALLITAIIIITSFTKSTTHLIKKTVHRPVKLNLETVARYHNCKLD